MKISQKGFWGLLFWRTLYKSDALLDRFRVGMPNGRNADRLDSQPLYTAKCNVVAQDIPQDHNERTVPIIMAGCIAHARNGHISTSTLKSGVIIIFLDPDFLSDPGNLAIRVHLRQTWEYLLFAWVSGPLGLKWVLRGKIREGWKFRRFNHNANHEFWLDGFLRHRLVGIF